MKRPKNQKVVEAIHANRGNLSRAAKTLGVSRVTLYDWLKANEDLRTELMHAREQLCDMAEDVLVKQLENDNLKAAIFVLTHIGRKKDLTKDPKGEIELGEFLGYS